jgi:hypothetical protein
VNDAKDKNQKTPATYNDISLKTIRSGVPAVLVEEATRMRTSRLSAASSSRQRKTIFEQPID